MKFLFHFKDFFMLETELRKWMEETWVEILKNFKIYWWVLQLDNRKVSFIT